ncbi:F-box protein [Pyrus ussuriensis x Pyrus communis]|uniref:F-box protein n=1 Tax=Pyrus ussuriensis x Pyrus communis TaxID=2448454 RepID=A0A5N5GRX9_9ROSA|nr:F-box protein [Pyrus ussuriensis x Pyrus communis]
MASQPSLPSEILFDLILTRIKSLYSLGRCRLVSKDWNHITYDSWFWHLFCKRSGTISGLLIPNKYSSTLASIDSTSNKTLILSSLLNFLPVPVKIKAVSSTHGLVFCVSQNPRSSSVAPDYFVCKPTTLQYETLPNPKTRYFNRITAMVVLRSKPLRYKIIRFSDPKTPISVYKPHHKLKSYNNLMCEVFDSNSWAWKKLKDVTSLPYCVFFGFHRPCVTACGACYWLLTNNQVFAFYYGDNEDRWEIFDLPQPVRDSDCFNCNQLVEYQGHLGLIYFDRRETFMKLWVMEDHDKKEWSKRQALNIDLEVLEDLEGYCAPPFPAALYNSDIALMKGFYKVIFYKFQDSSCKVARLRDQPYEIFKLQSDFEKVNLREIKSEIGSLGYKKSYCCNTNRWNTILDPLNGEPFLRVCQVDETRIKTSGKFIWLFSLLIEEGFLEAVEDRLMGCFGLPIALRIFQHGNVLLDAILLKELRQIFAYELRGVVCDDGLRDAKLANDVLSYKALYVRLCSHVLCFYPFGEVIGCHNRYAFALSSRRHWPYQVDCTLHERQKTPSNSLRLEPSRQRIGLRSDFHNHLRGLSLEPFSRQEALSSGDVV